MKRYWALALLKTSDEGACRVCGATMRIEAAHVLGREHDRNPAINEQDRGAPGAVVVAPDRIVPLCGPATDTTTCHGKYDAHRLDLLPYLTREEETQAVADVGIERARIRICGMSEYART